jgi:hypothetical protein
MSALWPYCLSEASLMRLPPGLGSIRAVGHRYLETIV